MNIPAPQLKLYAVTDRSWLKGDSLPHACRQALDGGATVIQLREKHLDNERFLQEGMALKQLCEEYHVPLIINDNVEMARILKAGVHIGQGDASLKETRDLLGAEAIIGVSCQTVSQALAAQRDGADYLGVGAIFPTSTKMDADAVEIRELTAICSSIKIPVVAIGGISLDNLHLLAGTGIAGIAVVSALFAAPDIYWATQMMLRKTNAMLATPPSAPAGAILDLDGTLLNSLPYWNALGQSYLQQKGIVPQKDLNRLLNTMELIEGAAYLKTHYNLEASPEAICQDLMQQINAVYTQKAPLLPGARERLQLLYAKGTRMALFTSTDAQLARSALERHHILQFFDCVISTQDLPYGKHHPEAYWHVLGKLGTPLHNTTVYEDAAYAIQGAQKAGLKVVICSNNTI